MLPDFNNSHFIQCPHCGIWVSDWRLLSGNTIGAKYWTDGKVDAVLAH